MGQHVVATMTNQGFGMDVAGIDHQHKLLVNILQFVGVEIYSDLLNNVFAK